MLTRPSYTVVLTTPDTEDRREVRVEVSPGDMFRAEYEAQKHAMGPMKDAPMNHTSVWVWCALVRDHGYTEDYRTFVTRDLYAMQADDDEEGPAVDPTQAGPSGSA